MKKWKAALCAALSLCVMAVPVLSAVTGAGAAEKTIEEQIAELDKKGAEYDAVLQQTPASISEKEAYGTALLGKISVMNEKIILTRQSMDTISKDIKAKQSEIDKKNVDADGQVDALCERLSLIYMAGSAGNLEILLGAKNFGDFIDKMQLVKTLSEYDRKIIDDVNGKIGVIEKDKKALEEKKTALESEEAKLNKSISDLNALVEKNKKELSELTAKSAAEQKAKTDVSAKTVQLEAEQAEDIKAEQEAAKSMTAEEAAAAKKAAAEAQKKAAQQEDPSDDPGYEDDDSGDSGESGGGSSSGGEIASDGYTWPCPGFYFLSSLWNEDRTSYNHGAIDIAGAGIWGAAVVAAESGVVDDTVTYCVHDYGKDMSEDCGCGGGFGNYVWMIHPSGKRTIYAHLSRVVVSPGESVTKGQVIGYVGSTGHSTGPHLHFECRTGAGRETRYNPMDELSAYWGMVSY